jgi:hypothetical protein
MSTRIKLNPKDEHFETNMRELRDSKLVSSVKLIHNGLLLSISTVPIIHPTQCAEYDSKRTPLSEISAIIVYLS